MRFVITINNLKHSQQVHLGQLFLDVNLITTFHEYDQDQAKGIACGRTKGHGAVKIFVDNATRKNAATRCPVERGRDGGGGQYSLVIHTTELQKQE